MMKSKFFGGLLSLAILFTSCDKITGPAVVALYDHYFLLNFQDASGNDLVKGIDWHDGVPNGGYEVNYDYTLEAIYPELYMDPVYTQNNSARLGFIPDHAYYRLGYATKNVHPAFKQDDTFTYLVFHPTGSMNNHNGKKIPPADKIIYQLKCPHIFGDDAVHEIVTYWKPINERVQLCYRIEFEGKFAELTFGDSHYPFATLVLDR